MASVEEFLIDTLVLINAHDPGETPSSSDIQYGFRILNRLIGAYNARGVMIPSASRTSVSTSGSSSYTVGSGQNINITRPLKVLSVLVNVSGATKGAELKSAEQWAAISDRSRAGLFAEAAYYDGGFPTGTLYLTPTPNTGGTVEVYYLSPLSTFSTISDTISLAPGYEYALQAALAVAIAPAFRFSNVPPAIVEAAATTEAAIAALNASVLGTAAPADAPTQQ